MKISFISISLLALLTIASCDSKKENTQNGQTTDEDSINTVPDENTRPTGDERSVPEQTPLDTTNSQ